MRKGQISIDLIVVLAVALIIFVGLLSSMNSRFNQSDAEHKRIYAKNIADRLATEINAIVIEGYGSNLSSYIPPDLPDATPFDINVIPEVQLVSINWSGNYYTSPIITADIIGDLQDINGDYSIININGTIDII